jgi:hypothetical protein
MIIYMSILEQLRAENLSLQNKCVKKMHLIFMGNKKEKHV